MIIIPAIDVRGGRVVRLRQGEFAACTEYDPDPVAVAERYAAAGFPGIHVVDLDAARTGAISDGGAVAAVLAVRGCAVQVGGGIRTAEHVQRLLDAGAARVVVGRVAARDPDLLATWMARFGPGRVAAAIDVRAGNVAVGGWLADSGQAGTDVLARVVDAGATTVICTDIDRDGLMQGPNTAWYAAMRGEYPGLELVASGGIAGLPDLDGLAACGASGAIVGTALYEGAVSLAQLRAWGPAVGAR